MDLNRRIAAGEGDFLLFSVTPPKLTTGAEKVQKIADATIDRLRPLEVDGLILYDINDESDRNPEERPFPFMPMMDPAEFYQQNLADWDAPVIIYRAVGKYAESQLKDWIAEQNADRVLSVFVGASARNEPVATSLSRAQDLRREANPELSMGGVAIPERHARRGDEHLRLLAKQQAGCSFVVTQVVFDVNAAKNLISDYHYECQARGVQPVPIVFTLSVCGSMKTLRFLRWLGVDVPRWIENELRQATDTLEASYEQALAIARELIAFCRRLGVPFGLNVESVSIRKVEIEASVRLASSLRAELRR